MLHVLTNHAVLGSVAVGQLVRTASEHVATMPGCVYAALA